MLDAGTLAGLLADGDRRSVFAALVLGSSTLDDVMARQVSTRSRPVVRSRGSSSPGSSSAETMAPPVARAGVLSRRPRGRPRQTRRRPGQRRADPESAKCSARSYVTVV
jgi:hypothetical protein